MENLNEILQIVEDYTHLIIHGTLLLIREERAEEYTNCVKINKYIPKIIDNCINELKKYGNVPGEVVEEIQNTKQLMYNELNELDNNEIEDVYNVNKKIIININKKYESSN